MITSKIVQGKGQKRIQVGHLQSVRRSRSLGISNINGTFFAFDFFPYAAQMLSMYSILRVYSGVSSTFRTPSAQYWSTGGLNPASTGSMSSTESRAQEVPAVLNPEILGSTGSIRSTEPRNTASTRST